MTATYNVLKELSARGHEITVLTTVVKGRGTPETITRRVNGMTVHYFKGYFEGVFFSPALLGFLPTLTKYDLVHANNYRNFPSDAVSIWARKKGIPTVVSANGSLFAYQFLPSFPLGKKLLYGLHDAFLSGPIRKARIAIAVSSAEARHYQAFGVPRERIRIVPNGVDLDTFSPGDPQTPLRETGKAKLVGYVGRLDPIKGLVTLLEAFEIVRGQTPETKLVFVGPDFGMKRILSWMINKRKLRGVLFLDPVPYRLLVDIYRSLDVVVAPSLFEVFGMSTLEAMACGRPVISTTVGGVSDLIADGHNGFLVRPGDHEMLANRIVDVLQNEETAIRLGTNARVTAEDYKISRTADLTEQAYVDCMSIDNGGISSQHPGC